jgi:hypothetical protein
VLILDKYILNNKKNKMKEIKAPNPIDIKKFSIFLGGSIEMGTAEKWQEKIAKELSDFDINIFNPRRDDWDSSWVQDIDNPVFYEQVNWELDGLGEASLIMFYFQPGTNSPITLLELGLHAQQDNVIVCCPEGFNRKGNVDIVCERYDIPLYETLEDLINDLKENLSNIIE